LRKAVVATMVAVFALAAGTAIAAGGNNADTGSVAFSSNKAGTKKKPHAIGYTLKIDTAATGSALPQVTREVKLKIYGMKVDGKHFAKCTSSQILAAKNDNVCAKKALVGSGAIVATLQGPAGTPPTPCTPLLDVWNSGQGKLTYFFRVAGSHQCGGLQTGSTPPYAGTYKTQGGFFQSDVKIPNQINYPLANLTGLLFHEHLFFSSQTKKVKGKKYISQAVTGCKKGKRPWTITVLTAPFGSTSATPSQTSTVNGSSSCK
jgi:hypothetical protein